MDSLGCYFSMMGREWHGGMARSTGDGSPFLSLSFSPGLVVEAGAPAELPGKLQCKHNLHLYVYRVPSAHRVAALVYTPLGGAGDLEFPSFCLSTIELLSF